MLRTNALDEGINGTLQASLASSPRKKYQHSSNSCAELQSVVQQHLAKNSIEGLRHAAIFDTSEFLALRRDDEADCCWRDLRSTALLIGCGHHRAQPRICEQN